MNAKSSSRLVIVFNQRIDRGLGSMCYIKKGQKYEEKKGVPLGQHNMFTIQTKTSMRSISLKANLERFEINPSCIDRWAYSQ